MACKLCPKIRKIDIIFIIIICAGMYGVDRYQSHKKEVEKFKAFEQLQKDCLFGNQKACREVYGEK
ncbi:hypothetical protein [Helicobacter sp. 11S03491-1]|uniref:hypothetical protein n=1 Tax=Helicobacter sp. 11S03491-1 TaxID=1476196 RepID=UPI000BA63D4C|nr:hypothetical protein [Helicobacter sp. 11S03491-1]PAF43844.1 hypothetical protein BKH45_00850 [Helicobacter sp. 11S03491-1]